MNNLIERIRLNFTESIQAKINTADTLLSVVAEAGEVIVQSLLEGHKILICGNGGSACAALHFASGMINRFKQERPALPVIVLGSDVATLTAIANDYHFNNIFAKQIRALGSTGDVLIALSTGGDSINTLNAIKTAHDKNIVTIALTGQDGGKIGDSLQQQDIEIRVPAYDGARIQETHLLILHCLSDIIDFRLFGHMETT